MRCGRRSTARYGRGEVKLRCGNYTFYPTFRTRVIILAYCLKLKTLFEHKNCVSIKPYYHQKDDEKDDYWDIVCNIARNISNPSLMRDRVVIKEHCEPLGQFSQNTENQ